MKLHRMLVLAAAVVMMAAPADAQEALAIGASLPAAERSMQNATGSPTSFNQQMGPRGLAVIFWSNTCPWVRRYEDRVIALAEEYQAAGVGFVAVNPNDPIAFPGDNLDAMRAHVAETPYPFPYLVDERSQAARAFGATRTPQVFLFNSDGRLVYEGTIDDSPADPAQAQERYFRDALNRVVAGEPVRVEKTRAFGCTIKFPD